MVVMAGLPRAMPLPTESRPEALDREQAVVLGALILAEAPAQGGDLQHDRADCVAKRIV